jgi:hypothetical protein
MRSRFECPLGTEIASSFECHFAFRAHRTWYSVRIYLEQIAGRAGTVSRSGRILSRRRRIVQQAGRTCLGLIWSTRTHERIMCNPKTEWFRSCHVAATITCPHPQVTDRVKTAATTTGPAVGTKATRLIMYSRQGWSIEDRIGCICRP